MNYTRIYANLMSKASLCTRLGYTETHHVIPRCMGGSDESSNLVRLTPEEHYLAHQLLVKIYPNNTKLVYAAALMCQSKSCVVRNNKLYGWLRRRLSLARKGVPKTEEHKQKLRDANLGKVLSDETCAKMSKSRMGKKLGTTKAKGIKKPPRTITHSENLAKSLRKPKSEEGKKNIGYGAIKRSIRSILEKKDLYILFFSMIDQNENKKTIRDKLSIREREYYTILNKRNHIENIIKEYTDAQQIESEGEFLGTRSS